nr:MAG TPA: methyltransferase-like protein [Caudoviricetes sp.]
MLGFRQFPSFKKYTSQYSSKSMIPLVYFPLLRSLLRTSLLHFTFPDGEEMERLNRYFWISSKLFSSLYILKIVFTTSACSGTISTNPYLSLLKP